MTLAWRLLVDQQARTGDWNMCVDRAIQLIHEQESAAPTLRLYRWARPTVSVGRFQHLQTVDTAYCAAHGIDIVRRPTGGRGVLHDDEVTYSIVAGTKDGIPRGTKASYRLLCSGLAEAYRLLGLDAALTSRTRGHVGSAACYLLATQADLSLGARKLSGSAQVWSGSTVLQHGSFTISRNVEVESAVFGLSADDRHHLEHDAVTLEGELSRRPSNAQIIEAVVAGFEHALDVELNPGTLTVEECNLATVLRAELSAGT